MFFDWIKLMLHCIEEECKVAIVHKIPDFGHASFSFVGMHEKRQDKSAPKCEDLLFWIGFGLTWIGDITRHFMTPP